VILAGGLLAALAAGAGPGAPVLAGDVLDLPVKQFHSYEPAPRAYQKAAEGRKGWQKDLEQARAAWRKGRYVAARKAFERAARQGSLVATWYLGHIYRLGRGARRDDMQAFRYYRKVALAYDAEETNRMRLMMTVDALVRVADYYRTGIGRRKLKRDPRRAFRLYNIAAGHGHPAAFYGLGLLALRGEGMRRRPRRALGWLMKAARLDYAPAAILLGDLARKGLKGYIRKDGVAALSWYLIAARLTTPDQDPRLFRRIEALTARLDEKKRSRAETLARQFVVASRKSRKQALNTRN
jgi:hypothetical protein